MKLRSIIAIMLFLFHGEAWALQEPYRPRSIAAYSPGQLTELLETRWDGSTLDLSRLELTDLQGFQYIEIDGFKIMDIGIKNLNLSKNQLVTVPDFITQLTSLEYLNLSKNQLTEVPKNIGRLEHLQVLLLFNNNLDTLPESIGDLGDLKMLNLTSNPLTSLPNSIGKLKENLLLLEISHTGLTREQRDDLAKRFWPGVVLGRLHEVGHKKTIHVAQKTTGRKKSVTKVAKHAKKEKSVTA